MADQALTMTSYARCTAQFSIMARFMEGDGDMKGLIYVTEAPARGSALNMARIVGRDPETTQVVRRFVTCKGVVNCMAATRGGLCVGMSDGILSVCDRNGSERHCVKAHAASIHALCTPASHMLWSCGADALVKPWALETLSPLRTYRGHTGPVRCLVALPSTVAGEAHTVWSGSDDRTLAVWDESGTTATASIEQSAAPRVMCAQVRRPNPQPRPLEQARRVWGGWA